MVLLAVLIVAVVFYIAPIILQFFPNVSYRYVLFFLILITASHLLAKVSRAYISA